MAIGVCRKLVKAAAESERNKSAEETRTAQIRRESRKASQLICIP
jgi:hypothetical protein